MSAIESAIAAIPHALAAALVRRDVVAVNYHLVAPQAPPHITGILPHKTPEQFEQDLLFIKRHYNPVAYPDIVAARNGGPPLPKHAILVTFDDGFRECSEHVCPLLSKHAVPAAFFLITDSIDNHALAYPNRVALCLHAIGSCTKDSIDRAHDAVREAHGLYCSDSREGLYQAVHALTIKDVAVLDTVEAAMEIDVSEYLRDRSPYLTSDQVRELQNEGIAFGAHTKTHPQLWLVDDDRFEAEIAGSCQAVCELTGESAAPFAFPYRSNGIARSCLAAIRSEHPQVGLMFDTHGYVRDAPFMVPRLSFDNPAGATANRSNLPAGLKRGYLAQIAKTMLGRGNLGA